MAESSSGSQKQGKVEAGVVLTSQGPRHGDREERNRPRDVELICLGFVIPFLVFAF